MQKCVPRDLIPEFIHVPSPASIPLARFNVGQAVQILSQTLGGWIQGGIVSTDSQGGVMVMYSDGHWNYQKAVPHDHIPQLVR